MEITLEDVESAIIVLTEFLKKQRQAERVLRQMGVREGRAGFRGFSFESFVETAFQEVKKRQAQEKAGVEEPTVELSDEDLKRMRAIAEKRKGELKSASTSS